MSFRPLLLMPLVTLMLGCQTHLGAPSPTAARGVSAGAGSHAPLAARPQLLVKFRSGVRAPEMQAFRAQFGTRSVSVIAGLGVYVEELTGDRPLAQVLAEMNASPLVEYAEPNSQVDLNG